eukprot:6274268-Pyramimonas_sp.AAC.1
MEGQFFFKMRLSLEQKLEGWKVARSQNEAHAEHVIPVFGSCVSRRIFASMGPNQCVTAVR